MFTKVHRPKNEKGQIVDGPGFIAKSSYENVVESGHSRQTIMERLVQIIEMAFRQEWRPVSVAASRPGRA